MKRIFLSTFLLTIVFLLGACALVFEVPEIEVDMTEEPIAEATAIPEATSIPLPSYTKPPKTEQELFTEFLAQELIPENGIAPEGGIAGHSDWSGLLSYWIDDFNNDGGEELLLVHINPAADEEGEEQYCLFLSAYSMQEEIPVLLDTVNLSLVSSALWDIMISTNENDVFVNVGRKWHDFPEISMPLYDIYQIGMDGISHVLSVSQYVSLDLGFSDAYIEKNGEMLYSSETQTMTEEGMKQAITEELMPYGVSEELFFQEENNLPEHVSRVCVIDGEVEYKGTEFIYLFHDFTGVRELTAVPFDETEMETMEIQQDANTTLTGILMEKVGELEGIPIMYYSLVLDKPVNFVINNENLGEVTFSGVSEIQINENATDLDLAPIVNTRVTLHGSIFVPQNERYCTQLVMLDAALLS